MLLYPTLFFFLTVTYSPSESKRCRCLLSQKHLGNGDVQPPPEVGRLRLFAMRYCPFSHKTVLILNAKRLPHNIVYINLSRKPEWFAWFSPKGTVPALEYEPGEALIDSDIVNAYLDEQYPDPPLQADSPLRRAKDRLLIENFSKVQSIYLTAAFHPEDLESKDASKFHKGLELIQSVLESRETRFLFGERPGLVDYALWPFLERIPALPIVGNSEFSLSTDRYSLLLEYMERMKEDPAVKSYYLTPELHAQYIENKRAKEDVYNILESENSPHCCKRPH